jgi:hypothetical protein
MTVVQPLRRHDFDAHGRITAGTQTACSRGFLMQDRVEEPGIVQCPGCHRPMEALERTLVKERLVDIRFVCATCAMETRRTVAEEAKKRG